MVLKFETMRIHFFGDVLFTKLYHMLLVLAKMCECGNKLSNVRSFQFCHQERA